MTEPVQGRRRFRRSGKGSDRVLVLVMVAALFVILAVFLYLAFFNQQHNGHGQADPDAQSMLLPGTDKHRGPSRQTTN